MGTETNHSPRQSFIPLCVPEIRGNELNYIKEGLDTNWVSTAGPHVTRFEEALARFVGARFAVATCNGTAALHISLLVSGVSQGDEVIVPALSFVASANTVRYLGAYPVFVDVDKDFWQIDVPKMREFIRNGCRWHNQCLINNTTGRKITAVMPVHLLGHPVDMDPLYQIAREYGLQVIEDASEALGAKYKGIKIGRDSQIAGFSFNGNKLITTGGGGMIVTNREDWATRARYLTTQAKEASKELVHNEIGYNYRLPNLLAAMGLGQLEQIESYLTNKKNIAAKYTQAFKQCRGIRVPREADWADSISWLYAIMLDEATFGMDSRELLDKLRQRNIETRPMWYPLHRLKSYEDCYSYKVENVENIYRQALCLPSSVGLTESDQDRVIETILELSDRTNAQDGP